MRALAVYVQCKMRTLAITGSRVPIKRGQYNFDNHKKPRFCPQQHIDDQRERALTKAKLVYY